MKSNTSFEKDEGQLQQLSSQVGQPLDDLSKVPSLTFPKGKGSPGIIGDCDQKPWGFFLVAVLQLR
ncbi:MAG: hypothetical protein V4773_04725 [Verrucomicrobiota bacterium]